MSKNIMIKGVDGSERILYNISHIVTDLAMTNGSCTWIPKDEIEDGGYVTVVYLDGRYYASVEYTNGDEISY